MDKKFKVSLYSGGKVVESWITDATPKQDPDSTAYRFRTRDGNMVEVCGTLSIEEGFWDYEEMGPQI